MAGRVIEKDLENRTTRVKLKVSPKPYWRGVDTGVHLGYRKGKRGGKWVMRRYLGDEQYAVKTIATADDKLDANGKTIMSFRQAERRVRELASAIHKEQAGDAPLTVAMAMSAYLEHLEHKGAKSIPDVRSRIGLHILPAFGDVLVADLTREQITRWLSAMASQPRQAKGKGGFPTHKLSPPKTEEEIRRRKATANRTLVVFRAGLNLAFADNEVSTDTAWRAVRKFRETGQARVRYFTTGEIRCLVNAAQGPFKDLVQAGLFTGCRYSELTRLRVSDFIAESGTVLVAKSKSARRRHVVLTEEGQRFFSQLTAGRTGGALMLVRADGSPWNPSDQRRPMIEACTTARITPAGFHTLRHTYASHLVMSGAPLSVIAHNLGHAEITMLEAHYGHLAPSYIAETIRKFAPDFGTAES